MEVLSEVRLCRQPLKCSKILLQILLKILVETLFELIEKPENIQCFVKKSVLISVIMKRTFKN